MSQDKYLSPNQMLSQYQLLSLAQYIRQHSGSWVHDIRTISQDPIIYTSRILGVRCGRYEPAFDHGSMKSARKGLQMSHLLICLCIYRLIYLDCLMYQAVACLLLDICTLIGDGLMVDVAMRYMTGTFYALLVVSCRGLWCTDQQAPRCQDLNNLR